MVTAGIVSSIPSTFSIAGNKTSSALLTKQNKPKDIIWANLLHLSFNMWHDSTPLELRDENYEWKTSDEAYKWALGYRPFLTFDEPSWNTLLQEMADVGVNMVVIDLGDAVQYESHLEIAVRDAWTIDKLRSELAKMRKMGLEPIPKLNFSAIHDVWLGDYARKVSTKEYYEVCSDLISEVIEIFNYPRFFHLGMDEEGFELPGRDFVVVRKNHIWWGDLYFFISQVEKKGVRPWIWADYGWDHPEEFYNKMPKSVVQSNWYYGASFDFNKLSDRSKTMVGFYQDLQTHGYDQIPTGSNHSNDINFESTTEYCKKVIDPSNLLGFMQTPWRPTLALCMDRHQKAVEQLGRAIRKY
jgi:hypothetical protein